MGFYDAFFGSDQSLYTAYAIMAAIIAICITIILTATDVPISNRIMVVLFVIITLVPSIFLTLFELTCIVTGGTEPNNWWCYSFAWILAAFIIIYCIFIVIISLLSLFSYNSAIDNVKNSEQNDRLPSDVSNNYAKAIIHTQNENEKINEKFYIENNMMMNPLASMNTAMNNAMNMTGLDSTALLNTLSQTNKPAQKSNETFYVEDDSTIDPMSLFKDNNEEEKYTSRNDSVAHFTNGLNVSASGDITGTGNADIYAKQNNSSVSVGTDANILGNLGGNINAGLNGYQSSSTQTKQPISTSSSSSKAAFTNYNDSIDNADSLYPYPNYNTAFNSIN